MLKLPNEEDLILFYFDFNLTYNMTCLFTLLLRILYKNMVTQCKGSKLEPNEVFMTTVIGEVLQIK